MKRERARLRYAHPFGIVQLAAPEQLLRKKDIVNRKSGGKLISGKLPGISRRSSVFAAVPAAGAGGARGT